MPEKSTTLAARIPSSKTPQNPSNDPIKRMNKASQPSIQLPIFPPIFCYDPFRVNRFWGETITGGVAALNHRLIATNPFGVSSGDIQFQPRMKQSPFTGRAIALPEPSLPSGRAFYYRGHRSISEPDCLGRQQERGDFQQQFEILTFHGECIHKL
jgi:hypothetical protein